jgi:hypothetical protein
VNKSSGSISEWTLRSIRESIRGHRVSFPSQVPVFSQLHRPDIQWRIVILYFIRGWSSVRIASRYGMTRERVMQLLRQWVARAIRRGYVETIPTDRECLG